MPRIGFTGLLRALGLVNTSNDGECLGIAHVRWLGSVPKLLVAIKFPGSTGRTPAAGVEITVLLRESGLYTWPTLRSGKQT